MMENLFARTIFTKAELQEHKDKKSDELNSTVLDNSQKKIHEHENETTRK